jgi:hypothetical protein
MQTREQFEQECEKLRDYFLAKGLPATVADVMAQYEFDDDVVAEMIG